MTFLMKFRIDVFAVDVFVCVIWMEVGGSQFIPLCLRGSDLHNLALKENVHSPLISVIFFLLITHLYPF